MLSSAARSAALARIRPSPSRSAMAATRRRPSLRRRDRLRLVSRIGRPLTARAGAITWTGCAPPHPVSRRTRCAGGFIIQRRWRCTPPRTRHSEAASVAGFGTPWGDFVNGDQPNDGYHRVWGRDLYQQAMGLIAAGDSSQALRMAQFLWSSQFVGTTTPGDGTTYQPGSFPRYTPVSGIGAATAKDLGCCEQLDEEAFAILLAWMTGLSDSSTYQKIKTTADHIAGRGAGDDGALGGAIRSIPFVDRGDHRWARRGCGHRAAEQRSRQRSPLGIDSRFLAFEPRRSDVHHRWILGRPSLF